jgi:hypothetical protein
MCFLIVYRGLTYFLTTTVKELQDLVNCQTITGLDLGCTIAQTMITDGEVSMSKTHLKVRMG